MIKELKDEDIINKKVSNSRKNIYDNIKFDSNLEIACYKLLKEEDINFKYNEYTIELLPAFRLDKVHYYRPIKKDRSFRETINKKGGKLKLSSIKYTPDFQIMSEDYLIFIETKGFPNDVYPYKRKIFFNLLEQENRYKDIYFFEPKNIKQIKESIEIIKLILHEKEN